MNKTFSWLTLTSGIFLGLVISPVIFLGLFVSGKLDPLLKSAYAQPEWPEIKIADQIPQEATSTAATQSEDVTNVAILVPKPLASEAYQASISSVISLSNSIAATNTRLTVGLQEMNRKSLAQEFDGFFDIIYDAKKTVEALKPEINRFGQAVEDLEIANGTVTDNTVRGLTETLVRHGRSMNKSLLSYMDAVDVILSGTVPTASQISNLYNITSTLTSQSESFNASAATLISTIGRQVEQSQ